MSRPVPTLHRGNNIPRSWLHIPGPVGYRMWWIVRDWRRVHTYTYTRFLPTWGTWNNYHEVRR